MLKALHTADLHFRPSKAADVFASLDVLEEHAGGSDLVIVAGDLYDYPVQNTGASQFPEYVRRVARIASRSPIVMVQGTPTHDSDGSLDIFEQASDRITVLKMGAAYLLTANDGIIRLTESEASSGHRCDVNDKALIFGIPEPQKKHLIAADTTITMDQAMHAVFLGYAAIRAKYKDLPCILVYHGQVHGAKMANGEICEGGVSIDDLALVGADYIAMGDIHKPQRVGISRGLHAYYPGAAHPTKDWNEAGIEFGFNRVTIEAGYQVESGSDLFDGPNNAPKIERIPYPHPTLIKLENTVRNMDPLSFEKVIDDIKGRRVWLELSATKEQASAIDSEGYLRELLDLGAVPGSRVTIKYLTTETVRAGEITALRRLRDKFTLWMQNSGRTPTDAQLDKCDAIEASVSGQGLSVAGGAFSFDKMILRGAKGIYKKQRKDEVVLDLTEFDSGILGLIGRNGRGKTTLMNNFHVWSTMPNMGGPLHKQFRLKDSLREVYATDHNTGMRYRSRIRIDPTLKAPKAEYYLDQDINGAWQSVPGITGRLDDYDEVVNRIFGTLEMYLRTAFMMQFPTSDYPDLSKATKGTKKQIMAALAGIEFYDLYKMNAKAKGDDLADRIKDADSRLSAMTENLGDHIQLAGEMLAVEDRVRKLADELPAKKAAGVAMRERVNLLEQRAADQRTIQDQIIEVTNRIPRDLASVEGCTAQIEGLRRSIEKSGPAAERVKQYDELKARESEIVAEKTRCLEENAKANEAYRREKEVYDAAVKAIERKKNDDLRVLNNLAMEAEKGKASFESAIRHFDQELAKPVPVCEYCGKTPSNAQRERGAVEHDLNQARADLAKYVEQIQNVAEAKALAEDDAEKGISALTPPVDPSETQKPFPREDELTDVQRAYHLIDIDTERRVIQEATTAGARIEELEKKVEETRARIRENQDSVEALKAKIDPELEGQLYAAKREIEEALKVYQNLVELLATERANAQHAREKFEEYEKNAQAIAELRDEKETLSAELADWRIVEKACGNDGIPALELDAVCPSIAAVATELLREYEDGRYSIRFDTTREGGKGNQIEDFLIMVIDNVDGEEQEFETLSGGEAVWIRKALQDAFGIIRGNNAGIKYLTGFLDESDSALFPEARIAYFRMLESAHAQSVRLYTVLVSHSSEIQEMLSQKIDIEKLTPAESEVLQ